MKYFQHVENIEQLKQEYKKLCFKNHPDLGGSVEAMQEINAEYEKMLERLANEFNSGEKDKDYTYNWQNDKFAEMIQKIITFRVDIEIIGSWIWVFNSYEYKDQLKELGFWFSKTKKAWVFSGKEKSRFRGHYSIDELRDKWSSQKIETNKNYIA